MKNEKSDKIWFVHMLRGLAALIIVYTHWGEMFWRSNEVCAQISFSSPTILSSKPLHLYLTEWLYKFDFNFGAFGIALFFILSGFVIPISIEKMGSKKFLFRRIFRLYPVYAFGLLLTCIVLYTNAKYNNINYPFTVSDYFKNMSLFRDFFWTPTIDNINWTLENEVKFYLICSFIAWVSNLRSYKAISITVGVFSFISFTIGGTLEFLAKNNMIYLYKIFYIFVNAAPYITFMFIGTCFYNLYKKYWNKNDFLCITIFLYVLFYVNMKTAYGVIGARGYMINFSLALLLFILAYLLQNKIHENRILSFFANISYPLYVTHGVIGYAMLSFLYKHQPYPYLILLETFLVIVVLSYGIHKFIEIPFNTIGYKIEKLVIHQNKQNKN